MSVYDFSFNIITLGNSGVGKTQIINKYTKNVFELDALVTLGIDFAQKQIQLEDPNNNTKTINIQMKILDTAGQEKYRAVSHSYLKTAHGILLVYDVTDKNSFDQLDVWIKQIKEHMASEQEIRLILIGNKSDLFENKKVSYDEAEKLALLNNMSFYETSALNGTNIKEAFEKLCSELITIDSLKITKESLSLNKPKTKSCCLTKDKKKKK